MVRYHHQEEESLSQMPRDWRHLHAGDPVIYLEQQHLIVCIFLSTRTKKWSLSLAKTGDELYTVIVPYGHPGLSIFRSASY
jgi:hypothetical protein